MYCAVVTWRGRAYVTSVKEDLWIPKAKAEVLAGLKKGYPGSFAKTSIDIDDLVIDGVPESRTQIYPAGFINGNDFVVRMTISDELGDSAKAPTFYEKLRCCND